MSTIAGMLAEYPPLAHLDGSALEPMAEHARMQRFDAGQRILRTGNPADTFYVLRSGRVSIEIPRPNGRPMVIETLEAGEVLGISWMLPPYRLAFDARCVDSCSVIAIDAAALRDACDADPSLGYIMYKHLSGVVRDRLQATRVQLIDVYGGAHGR